MSDGSDMISSTFLRESTQLGVKNMYNVQEGCGALVKRSKSVDLILFSLLFLSWKTVTLKNVMFFLFLLEGSCICLYRKNRKFYVHRSRRTLIVLELLSHPQSVT